MVPYPLATSYFGVEHVAILEHVISGTVLSIPGVGSQPALIDVSLEPDTYSNGWRVRSEFGFIGFLDEVEAAEYPDLHRLKASQATPQTVATVGIVDGELEVAVSLGLWPWMVPVNDQPAESALLAGGHGAVIDSAAGDLTDEQLSHLETQQFFVTLKVIDDAVVASCGDTVVGPCGVLSQLPGLRAAYAAAQEAGTVLAARAYSGGGMIAVDIPAEDATDTELFSPTVPPLRVPSGRTALPSTTTSRPTTPAQPEGGSSRWSPPTLQAIFPPAPSARSVRVPTRILALPKLRPRRPALLQRTTLPRPRLVPTRRTRLRHRPLAAAWPTWSRPCRAHRT